MLHKSFDILDAKADSEAGTFEATVAVFGNVDKIGDRILPGAFKDTLAKWAESGDPIPVILSHQWDNPMAHIGVVDEATETDKGLWVKGTLDVKDNDVARQVHRLMKRRSLKEFSFGYSIPKGGERRAKDGANDLIRVELAEVGPTLKGMNPATELHAVKSALDEKASGMAGLMQRMRQMLDRQEAPTTEEMLALARRITDELGAPAKADEHEEKADVTDKETKESRSVDPLRRQADAVALEWLRDGVPEQAPTKKQPQLEPEVPLDELKQRMRDEMLMHLSGGTT
jgi:HK97 family phage prohead protease